jgi:WD40 repeat protein
MPPIRKAPWLALALLLNQLPQGAAVQALAGGPPPRAGKDLHTDFYGDPLPAGAIARLGATRLRVGGFHQMAFVPDGKHLATASGSALLLWDLNTGRLARTISTDGTDRGDGFTGGFAFTPDGKRLLSYDVRSGPTPVPPGSRTPALLLWEFPSGKLLSQSPDLTGEPQSLAIRRDGRMAACATHYGDVLLWEPGKKALRRVVRGKGRERIHSLAFAGEGKHLIVLPREGGVSRRIDVDSGKVLKRADLGSCGRVALAPGDGTVATYTHPDQLYLHDTTTGKKRRLPLKEKVRFLDLSFSPDGHTLLAMHRPSETVQFWDAAKGQLLRRVRVPGLVWTDEHDGLLLSSDGQTLAGHEEGRVVRIWDARTGRPRLRLPGHVRPPNQLAFSADGKELVSYAHREASLGGQLYRWEAATGKLLTRVLPDAPEEDLPGANQDWLLAPGGRHLAERVGRATYHLYDGRTGKRLSLPDQAPPDSDWSFTPDGRALVTTAGDRGICLWDVTTGKPLRRLELDKKGGLISWLRFTPDGRTLATGEGWRKVHLWEAATGRHQATLTLPPEREPYQKPLDRWETAFSPDGRCLFTSNTTNLWVWGLVARREIGPFEQDEYEWGVVGSGRVAVSPDGRLLAWFDEAWQLRLYEVCTGRIVHRFEEGYSSIAFAPSGWRLATGCNADSSVLIWDLPLLFRSQPPPREGNSPEALWDDLSATDVPRAHRALWRLAALPEADTFLARQLPAVERVPPERLRVMVTDLGSSDFATREKAEQALAETREAARAALVRAYAGEKDVEVGRRLRRLQARLRPGAPARLREARAVMVLEVRGTAESLGLLRRLAAGLPEARLTREAKEALGRLAKGPTPKP